MTIRSIAANFLSTLACCVVLSVAAIAAAVELFGLRWSGSIGLYFVVWWTVLFVVLPFGARSQAEIGEVVSGTEPGAPAVPALRERAIWTTIASVLVFLLASGMMPLSGL
jgi:predicted secreted protein